MVWTGLHPGVVECREFGWFAVRSADGWTSADPGTPGAIEDLNRLISQALWNPAALRYDLPDDTTRRGPDRPFTAAPSGDAGRPGPQTRLARHEPPPCRDRGGQQGDPL